jgi:branched-chain amino acid transport system substrate-binding protein
VKPVKIGGSKLNLIALGLVVSGILVGCGDSGAGTNTGGTTTAVAVPDTWDGSEAIKIGCVTSISGDNKPWGTDQLEGCKLALNEFNRNGGLDGKNVGMIEGDTASKPDQAKLAAEKVLSQGVVAIVGEVSSGNTIQIANSAKEKGVPVVAVGATRTDLTKDSPHVFRVCYTDAFQGPVMAAFAFEKLHLKKIAILTDNALPYSQGLSDSFREKYKAMGGTIVADEKYESGGKGLPDYQGVLTNIAKQNPEGLFLSGYFTEVGPITKQARANGIKATFLGGDGWDSDTILTSAGDAILGGFFCNHYNNLDESAEVQGFLTKWKAAHGGAEPSTTMGALGYDAMALTLDALKRAKTKDSKGLLASIEDTTGFKGVSGEITLKGNKGNPPKKAIVVEVTKKNGANWQKFAVSYTPDQIK